ncbi:DUF4281 domain-containing protein [Lentzea tibetensis]|uniref:DUF4281 domain-containing protein n=1 Tax=Lentzea tibetensis TaxID=2591470 RepID=A0A563ELT0_9PSEU|nr:ABA4-like family protein [Lentzea tibetensis]TWP48103.1 DUF4281 domain-containing protein [Lentzea tibetensis]
MTTTLFDLTFLLVAPFWALMILFPKWWFTHKVSESPLIVLPPLAIFAVLAASRLPELWAVVSTPELGEFTAFVGTPEGAALIWAQVLAWDLFIGRWMYLESRRLDISPLLMAPIMVGTILLSPVGLPVFLAVRRYRRSPVAS